MNKMSIFDDRNIIDLTNLKWSLSRESSGTAGSFYKSYDIIAGKKRYYKLSSLGSDGSIDGNECIYEIIARNICRTLHYEHLEYSLLEATVMLDDNTYQTFLCRSGDFKLPGDKKITLENFYALNHLHGENITDLLKRFGFWQKYEDILLLDYLIFNRDRHGANVELLWNTSGYRLAPIFDNGLSFFAPIDRYPEMMEVYDMHKSGPANNYVGKKDTRANLDLVPDNKILKVLKSDIVSGLFTDIPDYAMTPGLKQRIQEFLQVKLKDLEVYYASRNES